MYLFILFFIVVIIILFLVFKFFPKLDSILKQYLPSQRVITIKSEMNHLDKISKENNIPEQNISDKIIGNLNRIAFMPFEYLYRGVLSFFPSLGR